MSISRSEILRKKKRPENEKSWKVMGVQWEVIGGQRKVSGRSWEVNEGFWEVKGWSLEITWRLDAHCQKKWASLGVKFSGQSSSLIHSVQRFWCQLQSSSGDKYSVIILDGNCEEVDLTF